MSFVLDALSKADCEHDEIEDLESAIKVDDFLNAENLTDNKGVVNKSKYIFLILFLLVLAASGAYLINETNYTVSIEPRLPSEAELSSIIVASNGIDIEPQVRRQDSVEKPTYNVTGHIYLSDGHSANKVFIDEKSYRIGSQLPDGYEVISITPQKLIVTKQGVQFTIESDSSIVK